MTIRNLPKKERQEEIIREAYRLADSGKFSGWHQIEMDLRNDGLSEARSLLDHRDIRSELNERCAAAQAAAKEQREAMEKKNPKD
jgi:hypothetical protein